MTSTPIEEDWSKSRGGGGRNGVLCEHMAGDIRVGIMFEPLNVQMAFTATTFMEVGPVALWKAIKESELWAQCWDPG